MVSFQLYQSVSFGIELPESQLGSQVFFFVFFLMAHILGVNVLSLALIQMSCFSSICVALQLTKTGQALQPHFDGVCNLFHNIINQKQ